MDVLLQVVFSIGIHVDSNAPSGETQMQGDAERVGSRGRQWRLSVPLGCVPASNRI